MRFIEQEKKYIAEADIMKTIDLTGKKILVVDDNELNREITEELLAITGADILSVNDGLQAVNSVTEKGENFYSLILMDINMPNMDGCEATRVIRSLGSPYHTELPIIAYTSDVFYENIQAGKKAGMNEVLAKPIDIEQLCAVLEQWLK